jgi:hypothetical protein
MKDIFLFFPFQTIFNMKALFMCEKGGQRIHWGFKTTSMFISLLCIDNPAGNSAIY